MASHYNKVITIITSTVLTDAMMQPIDPASARTCLTRLNMGRTYMLHISCVCDFIVGMQRTAM